jgi:retinol dehydrogenase-12
VLTIYSFIKLDLGDIAQSIKAAEEFLSKESRLDILVSTFGIRIRFSVLIPQVNSAGVMFPPEGSKTADGYEMQFGTNVIGHFAFTKVLEPLLASTGKSQPPGSVRLVWVSSSGVSHLLLTHRR